MRILATILIILAIVFIGWQLWFALLIGVKEPSYTVLEKKDGYEIRKYDPYIIAEVEVTGTAEGGANKGFKILADYIFGKNKAKVKMPMTSPVFVETGDRSVSARRSPSTSSGRRRASSDKQEIAFVMPDKYTKKTLPKPENKEIDIEEKKGKIFAVYRFTWYPGNKRVAKKKELFAQMLKRDNIKPKSDMILARYNPPFILPFLMRNELLVEVKKPRK